MRRFVLPLGLVAFVTMANVATAAPTKQACVAAYEETQTSMRHGKLLHARETLQTCLDNACATVLRTDCADWLKEVDARMPSVVVASDARDARLFVDGQLHEGGIDGKAIELDPGPHTFRVEPANGAANNVEVVVREGEKLKVVSVSSAPSGTSASTKTSASTSTSTSTRTRARPVPWPVYLAGGIGAATAVGFGVFAISGMAKKSDLESCKPNCSSDRIDGTRTQFIVADVFLGITVVAVGVAAYFFLTRPTVEASGARTGLSVDPDGARLVF